MVIFTSIPCKRIPNANESNSNTQNSNEYRTNRIFVAALMHIVNKIKLATQYTHKYLNSNLRHAFILACPMIKPLVILKARIK